MSISVPDLFMVLVFITTFIDHDMGTVLTLK